MPDDSNESDLLEQIRTLKQRIVELESNLVESEKNFRLLTDNAPVGIYLDNANGEATYINKKCAELVGVPAENALEFDWIPYLHPDDREMMVSEWQKAFESSGEFHLEYRWVHEDGSIVWTLGEVIPILDDDGNATMYIGTLTDITPQKEAELEKEALKTQLLHAQKMESIGRLAGGVAHDYNNMLGVIIGYAEIVCSEVEENGSVHKKVQEILKAANRSADITRQLLGFARKQIIIPVVFDLNKAVNDLLQMLVHLIGEDIKLEWLPCDGEAFIMMDPSQFDQILMNLCVNSRDAINGIGNITISSTRKQVDMTDTRDEIGFIPGEYIQLSVSDDGCGMDSETLENVFEPFFTTKKIRKGTGLGLASVYGTVLQNNGFVDVHSDLGKGSQFDVYFPAHVGHTFSERPINTPEPIKSLGGETILVVEDEVAILEVVKSILVSCNYNVLAMSSCKDALEIASSDDIQIDLLITDVIMPEMNGRELAIEILSKHTNMRCLFMSGYTSDIIANEGVLEDKVNFIQKPFDMNGICKKIREILD